MKKIAQWYNLKSNDELFEWFIQNLKLKGIIQYSYFVDWDKVLGNVDKYQQELNILNSLIGKTNIYSEFSNLLVNNPSLLKIVPSLLAIRTKKETEKTIHVLTDFAKFIYSSFDFSTEQIEKAQADEIATFFMKTGLGKLLENNRVTNFTDFIMGIEVGLDTHGKKNRGGHQMEFLIESYVEDLCSHHNLSYLKEANVERIKKEWGIVIKSEKSSKRIDFVILNPRTKKISFIEVNFYHGGGSKLKSTAQEYTKMHKYWSDQDIEFIWITDGAGWLKSSKPLRDYFDKFEYLINLKMLQDGILLKIFN